MKFILPLELVIHYLVLFHAHVVVILKILVLKDILVDATDSAEIFVTSYATGFRWLSSVLSSIFLVDNHSRCIRVAQ